MTQTIYDVAIIGAGAAGLMGAIQSSRLGLSVLLLDGKPKVGAKILMSGGTRCNVTNQTVSEKDFAGHDIRFCRNVLRGYSSKEAIRFFKEIGVDLREEPGGKLFPSTHRAQTVLDALLSEAEKQKVTLLTQQKVGTIRNGSPFEIETHQTSFYARAVLLATGGLSYPNTGSDGSGYKIAETLGHSLIKTIPALTPLKVRNKELQALSGVSAQCRMTLLKESQKQITFEGPILFTHFGISGPVALNISRHWQRAKEAGNADLKINFLTQFKEDAFLNTLSEQTKSDPKQSLLRFLSRHLPNRLALYLLNENKVSEDYPLGQFSKEMRRALVEKLFHYPLEVAEVYGYAKAEVTAGGVNTSEVHHADMQSKITPGVFFCGEILDVDGRIGGFNFQWAWSSAVVAARGVHRFLESKKDKECSK